jgi:hypothetical protein
MAAIPVLKWKINKRLLAEIKGTKKHREKGNVSAVLS